MPCSIGWAATHAENDPLTQGLESRLLAALKDGDVHPAARGFADDAAVLGWPLGLDMVATHDMMAEGVHFTPDCPPADIGWKLAVINLSDLAAMGARPVGVLLGAGISVTRDSQWALAMLSGVREALRAHECILLGGDTIRSGPTSILSLTALGHVPPGRALPRGGAQAGDDLWVSGTIGDAGLGLLVATGEKMEGEGGSYLLSRYRRPTPRVDLGLALRGVATAAMDVSDGLLIDAGRLAEASGLSVMIEAARIPLSKPAAASGIAIERLAAMGDDYELLFAAPATHRDKVAAVAAEARVRASRIGQLTEKTGEPVILLGADGHPLSLIATGYQHG